MNEPMPSLSPDQPSNSNMMKWIIVAVVVLVLAGAAFYVSTQTNLLKGTVEVNTTPTETENVEMANDDQMGIYNSKLDETKNTVSGEDDLERVVEAIE